MQTTRPAQYPTVTLRHSLPRSHRLALALALLAVLAQLCMAPLGTRHLGQMLWQQTLWGEVCTAYNSPHTALHSGAQADPSGASDASDASDSGNGADAFSRMASCPVCSAASAAAAPSQLPVLALAARGETPYLRAPASAVPRALRHASLRPPAQAPPHA